MGTSLIVIEMVNSTFANLEYNSRVRYTIRIPFSLYSLLLIGDVLRYPVFRLIEIPITGDREGDREGEGDSLGATQTDGER